MTRHPFAMCVWSIIAIASLGVSTGCTPSMESSSERAPDQNDGTDQGVMGRRLTQEEREAEVGKKLALIQPGMTKRQVVGILGPPDREDPNQFGGKWEKQTDGHWKIVEFQYVIYYCSPPNLPPGAHLMTIMYRTKPFAPINPEDTVIEVSGPHTPDFQPPNIDK